MPTERIAMRRVREMLKLRLDAGLPLQEVALRSGIARSTLREMVGRFEASGLAWPLPLDLSDAELEVRLYGDAGSKRGHRRKPEPDWAVVHRELRSNRHVTLETLRSVESFFLRNSARSRLRRCTLIPKRLVISAMHCSKVRSGLAALSSSTKATTSADSLWTARDAYKDRRSIRTPEQGGRSNRPDRVNGLG
jgi:hypothetical protein